MRIAWNLCKVGIITELLCLGTATAYQWPFNNTGTDTTTYHIDGTLGEYRGSHLHNGVDINKDVDELGALVYAVNRGKFNRGNIGTDEEYVLIRTIDEQNKHTGSEMMYMHVDSFSNTTLSIGTIVEIGTPIAKIKDYPSGPHLHFTERDQHRYYNPLRIGGLANYTDDPPTGAVKMLYQAQDTFSSTGIQFLRDLSPDVLPPNRLDGRVDILVPVHDRPGTLPAQRIGIYKLEYWVRKDGLAVDHWEAFKFDDLP